MATPDYMIGPDGTPPPGVDEATVFAAILGEPVLILLVRYAITQITDGGALVTGDAFADAIARHGGQRLVDLDFAADPAPGWTTELDHRTGQARVSGPAGIGVVYTGDLTANSEWRDLIDANRAHGRGLVLIVGTGEPTEDAALEMIAAGRASWVRTALA